MPFCSLLTYNLPEKFLSFGSPESLLGSLVYIPLGSKKTYGILWSFDNVVQKNQFTEEFQKSEEKLDISPQKSFDLKDIEDIFPSLLGSASWRRFLEAMAYYYITPLGKVLNLGLPSLDYKKLTSPKNSNIKKKPKKSFECCEEIFQKPCIKKTPPSLTKSQEKALEAIKDFFPSQENFSLEPQPSSQPPSSVSLSTFSLSLPPPLPLEPSHPSSPNSPLLSSPASSLSFSSRHLLTSSSASSFPWPTSPQPSSPSSPLLLSCSSKSHASSCLLLHGITGSGKTEVLFRYAETFWSRGQQVLFLLPEISLTIPWLQRYEQYYNHYAVLWHSFLTPKQRLQNFHDSVTGKALCIIGARSALFLPYKNLGLIVVDEEHEQSYKQNEGILYHGRDMALLRGKYENIPVILSSASPSLETMYHVKKGHCAYVPLLTRYNNLPLVPFFSLHHETKGKEAPSKKSISSQPISLEDSIKKEESIQEKPKSHYEDPQQQHLFHPKVLQKIAETLERKEQSLIFLNKRGYAALMLCPSCAYRYGCPRCKGWLSAHKAPKEKLLCHYCQYKEPFPSSCRACGFEGPLKLFGPGIEQIYDNIAHYFPQARLCLVSSDYISSEKKMQGLLQDIHQRNIDIIVGTQLVAKGHHFPYLTSIVLLGGDQALQDIDFRGQERWMQTMIQVTGRAGRAERQGEAFLQTRYEHHPLFQSMEKGNFHEFSQEELRHREANDLPPFRRLTLVTFVHKDAFRVQERISRFLLCQPSNPGEEKIRVFGPSPAPLSPLKGKHRWRLLLQSHRSFSLSPYLQQWIKNFAPYHTKDIPFLIDRDPYYLL